MSVKPTGPGLGLCPDVRPEAERNFRWNAFWFAVDNIAFGIGLAFLNQSTVLPTFVSRLTESPLLIGMIATIQNGTWLLPQLISAGLVAGKPRKRRYLLAPSVVGRPSYLILAALVFTVGAESSTLLLVAFFGAIALYTFCDGLTSVPWFDIYAKAIPADRRGRYTGAVQIAAGAIGIGLGGVVGYILAHPSLPFPRNYAVLFALAGVTGLLDLAALAMIREPAEPAREVQVRRSIGGFLRLVGPILRQDPRFLRVNLVRLAFGAGTVIFPFYIVYANRSLGLGAEHVGFFLSAQVAGGVVGALFLGLLTDHHGSHVAMRAAIASAALAPAIALLTHFAGPALGPGLVYVTAGIFVAIGVTFSSWFLGFMNYLLEIAPPDQRTTYTGLFNTIGGTLLVVPLLAGWLVEVASYPPLFGLALAFIVAAGLGSLSLPESRAARPAAEAGAASSS